MVRFELSGGLGSRTSARFQRGPRYLGPKKPLEIALVSGVRKAELPRFSQYGA